MVQAMIFVTFWHFYADFTCAHGRIRSPIANSILLSPKISFTFPSSLDAKSGEIQQDRHPNLYHFAKLQILYYMDTSHEQCQKNVCNSATFLRWSKPQTNHIFVILCKWFVSLHHHYTKWRCLGSLWIRLLSYYLYWK